MITEQVMGLLTGILNGLLSLMPGWSVDLTAVSGSGASIGSNAYRINEWFPVDILAVCLVLIFTVDIGVAAWRLLVFVYELIPFKAT